MSELYPLRFHPVYKDYIWGGRRLETILKRRLDSDGIYAESWEIADHPEGESLVAAGPLVGKSLRELLDSCGEALLGRHYPQSRFPLLLKYLDAHQHLSLQVHPDDRCAAAMGLADPGKTEAWYVIDAEPGGCLWAGFAQPVDRSTVEQALRNGGIEHLLHRVEPRPGDCIFVPAGTVHALGAGLMVAEIQQMSNNTFRLYDWGRVGSDGTTRPLHIDQGLQAIDYDRGPVEPTRGEPTDRPGVARLVACEQFVLDRWRVDGQDQLNGENRCLILTVVEGALSVEGDVPAPLQKGQTLLIPAAYGPVELNSLDDGAATFLVAYLP